MSILIENVTKFYGRHRAVDDISLEIHAGELLAFLGPNGAGKTTTIKMLAGLLKPDSGRIAICGHPMETEPLEAKARLAYVPDQPFLYDKLSAREFLHFVAEMYGLDRETTALRMQTIMDRLRIEGFAGQLAESYSHGMKQKVALAGALLHDPEVLIVDEPMVGLDPAGARTVKDLFRERANDGKTVFMSTHTLEIAEAIADRIAIINQGRIIACGTMEDLRRRARREHGLEDIFLELVEGASTEVLAETAPA